jgi:hypothetical protein
MYRKEGMRLNYIYLAKVVTVLVCQLSKGV